MMQTKSVDLSDIIKNRAEVTALLKRAVGTSSSRDNNSTNAPWISPHEAHLPSFQYNLLDNSIDITSLVQLHENVFNHRMISAYKIPKLFLTFDSAVLPDSSLPRPSLEDVRVKVMTGKLNIAVYSLEGYNFSLEYSHVYNGDSAPENAFDDILAVAFRAIRACDTSLSMATAKSYAEYMVRIAAWEVENAKTTCYNTLISKFPSLKATVYENMNFYSPHLYIGLKSDLTMCFWVRLCPAIESTSDDTGAARDIDKAYEKHTCLCFYHRYILNPEVVEELDLAGFADSSTGEEADNVKAINTTKKRAPGAVPPPPKAPGRADICVGMLLRNPSVERPGAKMSAESELDVSVDTDADEALDVDFARLDDQEADDAHVYGPATPRQRTPREKTSFAGSVASPRPVKDIGVPQVHTCNPSPFAELYGWGRNSALLFDKARDTAKQKQLLTESTDDDSGANYVCFNPASITIPPSINLERVLMVACSHRHMLLLTFNGSVYSCGDNTEGALGLGDAINRTTLTLVMWPEKDSASNAENSQRPENENGAETQLSGSGMHHRVVHIAAGSSAIGSHSAAVTESGELYGWGVPYASGHGIMEPYLVPERVVVSHPLPLNEPGTEQGDTAETTEETRNALHDVRVKSVSCGGGFTVALLASGHVASWGMWSHGRLGLGPPPLSTQNRGRGAIRSRAGRNKRKIMRYQLRPRIVNGITNAVKISCGESHALCLCTDGKVYAWGQNSCGQLGIGPTPSGFLRDAYSPVRVHFASTYTIKKTTLTKEPQSYNPIVDICCGTFHSLAYDVGGRVWSWGGRGDSCLGHNDAPLSGTWANRALNVFATATNSTKLMVPFELLEWCKRWSLPRHVKALDNDAENTGDAVLQMSAGDMHSAFLFDSGRFYICGSGPVVPPISSKDESDDGEEDAADDSTAQTKDTEEALEDAIQTMQSRLTPVTTPRCPSSMWLDRLAVRITKYICSAGTYMVVIQDEDLIGSSLTEPLLVQATNNNHMTITTDTVSDTGSVSTSSTAVARQSLPPVGRGKADCMLIAAGKILLAHRGMVASRCAVLREKLIEEAPMDDGIAGSTFTPTQVLLPDLVNDTARALHVFLYTGSLPPKCVKNLSIVQSLQRAAKRLRLPRLIAACDRLVQIHSAIAQSIDGDEYQDDVFETPLKKFIHSTNSGLNMELPPSTLARDLGTLVGDSQYADVRFIAEGRSISAHRFILEARCEYFRMMFNSGMSESIAVAGTDDVEDGPPAVVDIVVPDSFVGLLRLLIYLYTDILPDGSDGALLEDLMSADRYQVNGLKRLCESMLVPSHSNWLDLLRAAYLFNSPQLEVSVLGYLRDNVGDIIQISDLSGLSEEFPTLISDVMELRRVSYPLPPSQSLIEHSQNMTKRATEKSDKFHMPWWAIALGLAAALLYQHFIRVIALGPLVPVINIFCFIGILVYFYQTVLVGA